jgi:serine/threonine-protein kinase
VNKLGGRRVIADKYRLDRALAAGGMGSVWSAWNTHLDVPVAIKFMAPAFAGSPELVARFEREARAAAQIRSPHVVQIFEHGVDDGLPFIVMELLEGEDLGTRMRRVGRLSLEETTLVVQGVCRALRRAHGMGIVHRDLKPANVFLAEGDDEDETIVKVLDFGVVKSLGESVKSGVTRTGELIGTPHYMSPEQARSTKTVDHRSDLWSLGVIAYRALTASLPFPEQEGIEMLLRVCTEPAPPPSKYAPDLDHDVDRFFARALAINPDERFQSAREMADEMSKLAGVPTSSWSSSHLPAVRLEAPPSSHAYTSHAYVYTSASDADEPAPRSPRPAAERLPGARPPLATRPSPAPRRAPLADLPTRPSAKGYDDGRTAGSERLAPLVAVVSPRTLDEGPAATHDELRARAASDQRMRSADASDALGTPLTTVTDDLDARHTARSAELAASSEDGSRRWPLGSAGRPRIAIVVTLGAVALATVGIALSPRPHEGRAAPPSAAAISWTTALGSDLASAPFPVPFPSAVAPSPAASISAAPAGAQPIASAAEPAAAQAPAAEPSAVDPAAVEPGAPARPNPATSTAPVKTPAPSTDARPPAPRSSAAPARSAPVFRSGRSAPPRFPLRARPPVY